MFTPREFWELMQQKMEDMGIDITLEELIVEYAKLPKKRMYEWKDLNIPNKSYREKIRKAMDDFVNEQSNFGGAA